jgi:lysophospholipase L1-like esterase
MMTQAMLGAFYPAYKIHVLNTGVSGNTIRDLDLRWQTDVLDLAPDYVSLMCGINDVWRQFNIFDEPEKFVEPEEFRALYDGVVKRTTPRVKGMFLLTPFFLESNRTDAVRVRVGEYASIVKDLAARHQLPCVDSQALFDDYIDEHHTFSLSKDRVHLNAAGHMLLAREVMKLLGVRGREVF